MSNILDTKGLRCPLPVLKARKALKDVPPGGILTVLATDEGAVADFPVFCEASGCELIDWSQVEGVYTFNIRKPEQ